MDLSLLRTRSVAEQQCCGNLHGFSVLRFAEKWVAPSRLGGVAVAQASGHIDQRRCDKTRWCDDGCISAKDPTNRRIRETVRQPVVNTAPCRRVVNFRNTDSEKPVDQATKTTRNAVGTLPLRASLLRRTIVLKHAVYPPDPCPLSCPA